MNRLVIGCGYLGERVARKWVGSGDQVYAITRSPARARELESQGIGAILADVTAPPSLAQLTQAGPDLDTVLLAVGMDRTTAADRQSVVVDGLRNVLEHLPPTTKQLIYISSTGVFGDFDGQWVDESSPTQPTREGGRACLAAEQLIADSPFFARSTVLRFAGIYGPGRVPSRRSIESGDWQSNRFLNLIHVDDGTRVINTISNHPAGGETFLVSDGHPPRRREYHEFIAAHLGIKFSSTNDPATSVAKTARSNTNKRISNQKLVSHYSFEFEFPDFRAGLEHALGPTKVSSTVKRHDD